jgi:hypothetical protein
VHGKDGGVMIGLIVDGTAVVEETAQPLQVVAVAALELDLEQPVPPLATGEQASVCEQKAEPVPMLGGAEIVEDELI